MFDAEKNPTQNHSEQERTDDQVIQLGKSALNEAFSAEKLEKRSERVDFNEEAKTIAHNFAKKAAVLAMAVILTVGTVTGCGRTTKEIMNTDRARYVREYQAESIVFHGGPNLRSEPNVIGRGEITGGMKNNILIDLGNEDQTADSSYKGVIYRYDNGDANGAWIGFPAAELADSLREDSLISSKNANKIKNYEEQADGIVWINESYVNYKKVEEPKQ